MQNSWSCMSVGGFWSELCSFWPLWLHWAHWQGNALSWVLVPAPPEWGGTEHFTFGLVLSHPQTGGKSSQNLPHELEARWSLTFAKC